MLPVLLATLLAALIIPLVRLFVIKSFRNRIGNPFVTVILPLFAIALYFVILGVLALVAPALLYLITVPVVLVLAYLFWRARPNSGRSRGLPPGSLALFPTGPWNDALFYEKNFARFGPIFKTSNLYRPEVCIAGIERSREFLFANGQGIQTPDYPFGKFIPGGFLRFANPARHKETRPIFQSALTPAVYLSQQAQMQEIFRRELALLSQASLAAPNGIRPKPSLDRAMRQILIRLFFGVDVTAPEFSHFGEMLDAVAPHRVRTLPHRKVPEILDELMVSIRNQVAESHSPSFAAELARVRPDALGERYFTFNLIFMFQLGRNDVAGLLQWVIKMLADNPAWLARVRGAEESSDLPTRIVLETLRLQQSEFLIRQSTREITFQGYTIPRGWYVRLCIKESHHLSDAFENPTLFNPDRFLNHRFSRSEYMPFGAFIKTCLGEHLTLALAKMYVTELGNNYALDVTSDGPQENNGFHWQPSTEFRVRLLPYPAPASAPLRENKIPVPRV